MGFALVKIGHTPPNLNKHFSTSNIRNSILYVWTVVGNCDHFLLLTLHSLVVSKALKSTCIYIIWNCRYLLEVIYRSMQESCAFGCEVTHYPVRGDLCYPHIIQLQTIYTCRRVVYYSTYTEKEIHDMYALFFNLYCVVLVKP